MNITPRLLITLMAALTGVTWAQRPWDAPTGASFENAALPGGIGHYTLGHPGFDVDVVVDDLEAPWDFAFLPGDGLLVTEKRGRLLRIDLQTGHRRPVSGVPEVAAIGQGGLFAVVLHPAFAQNHLLYLSFAAPAPGGYTTRLLRGRLEGDQLLDVAVIFSASAPTEVGHHFGGAVEVDPAGYVFLSIGDRGEPGRAQDLGSHQGKIVRLLDDGRIPAENPFVGKAGALPEIWSFGHRNPQGLARSASGTLWSTEHGPRGGDELNRIEPGKNYGWPIVSHGEEYTGGPVGEGSMKAGMEPPVHYYVPSIATAGLAIYEGERIPTWKDSLLIPSLRAHHLNRVQLQGGRFEREERVIRNFGRRMRSVRISPSGEVWVSSDQGKILRLKPAG